MDKWALRGHFYSYVDLVRSLYDIGPCCHVIVQVVYWVELPVQRRLCPIFVKSWVLEKGDSMVWCQVTRHPRIFCELTDCQRTLRIWGVTMCPRNDTSLNQNSHLLIFAYNSFFLKVSSITRKCVSRSSRSFEYTRMSSINTTTNRSKNGQKTQLIKSMKVVGAFANPNGITRDL